MPNGDAIMSDVIKEVLYYRSSIYDGKEISTAYVTVVTNSGQKSYYLSTDETAIQERQRIIKEWIDAEQSIEVMGGK